MSARLPAGPPGGPGWIDACQDGSPVHPGRARNNFLPGVVDPAEPVDRPVDRPAGAHKNAAAKSKGLYLVTNFVTTNYVLKRLPEFIVVSHN